MLNNYALRIQSDKQFRFWISILIFIVGSVFVAADDPSQMFVFILLFVSYSAIYGIGHFLSKTNALSKGLHYALGINDCVFNTVVVYFTGGIESPFFLLYLISLSIDLYYQSLFEFVFDCVLAFSLYGGLLAYQTLERDMSFLRMVAQLGLLSVLVGFMYALTYLFKQQEKRQEKLVSRSRTMGRVANVLCGSLANSKQWIKQVTSLIEEEIHPDGFKCRISIHKGNLQFMPPNGGFTEIQIPIMVGECIFGAIIITHDSNKPLSSTDQEFFSSIAVSLGLALHRAKLWNEIQEKNIQGDGEKGASQPTDLNGHASGNPDSNPSVSFIEVVSSDF